MRASIDGLGVSLAARQNSAPSPSVTHDMSGKTGVNRWESAPVEIKLAPPSHGKVML
jgi:hypothetical protein